ncbi:MAG: tetratricopeptide repeat protein [Xanthomonadales bacterium]|nr:tetratricopeptide repeat protein [Xanthomonadales bacterium]
MFLMLLACVACAAQADADVLSRLGWQARDGVARGYLQDDTCGHCHQKIAQTYSEVGMARAFSRPLQVGLPKEFEDAAYTHPATGQRFRLYRRDDALWFEQRARDGNHALTLRVDWAIGSGHRAQSFLHRTASGELYQLPVTWYAESQRLAASPGYESAQHPGVERRITHGCLFCHNAYPDVADDADGALSPDVFPKDLPQGIGCQRCHGPGAAHVRTVLGGAPLAEIRSSIVQPGKLDWATRNDVCFQCHLLPAVEVIGPRRIDRDWYDFRPGQRLRDDALPVDVSDAAMPDDARFQINHHAWRMLQSPCYIESDGQMGCTSCHDPHVRRVGVEARGWYRERCLACHEDLPRAHGEVSATDDQAEGADERDCVACHLPKRRTQDVIEATMTDHRIVRRIDAAETRLAPRAPHVPELTDIRLFDPPAELDSDEAKTYRALAALDHGIDGGALDALARHVARIDDAHPSWWLRLARHQAGAGRWDDAAGSLTQLPKSGQASPDARFIAALVASGQGHRAEARAQLADLARTQAFLPEASYNLGLLALRDGDAATAIRALTDATRLRPLSATSWLRLAIAQHEAQQPEAAHTSLTRALEIRPDWVEAEKPLWVRLEHD